MKAKSKIATTVILSLSLQVFSTTAFADECKDLGEAINKASWTALRNLTSPSDQTSQGKETAAISKAATTEIFLKCARFIEIKCDKYNWIDSSRSMKAYCQTAVVTERRHRDNASNELLENSSQIKEASGTAKVHGSKTSRPAQHQR